MSADSMSPAFKAQFEEIARLEAALRSGKLTGEEAAGALRRLYELMDWQVSGDVREDVDYLTA